VPFGEYIPARSLVQHVANLSLVPRDAIAGHGPGLLSTPAGPLGVVISYEVFYEGRARAAIRAGGQVLLVPTNASSYATSQIPAQEIAAARLRAWETGRDTLQAAPTGYSALITHDGKVVERTVLGRQQVIVVTAERRTGQTIFVQLGDLPFLLLAAAILIGARVRRRRLP
jgi:apolipoprotein N-acyltransferase